jgi:coenzyme F420 hydrogenase subunit beta
MTQATTLESIVRGGLCAGCGICESLAGRDTIEMVDVDPGRVRPKVKAPLDAATEARIVEVCPGVHVDGATGNGYLYPGVVDPVVGPTIACYLGHATDEEVRFKAAAGGGLTTLGRYLIETGAVERVLHVMASREAPMRSHHRLSFDRATMLSGASSRYGPVAPLVDVMAILDEGRPFAFIGKPCDVNAMRNLARIDPRVDELVPYMLTISCGGLIDYDCIRAFLARHGLEEKELVEFRYRGHGWPGDHYGRAADGREAREWYAEIVYEHHFSSQFRCKLCPDHTGEQADVSVMDPWPTGRPEGEAPGECLFQTRTEKGDALVQAAAQDGYLDLEPSDVAFMRQTQPHQVIKKRGILARLFAMRWAGHALPRFRNIRLARAALGTHPMFHWRNFVGALRRIHAGGTRERMP